MEDLKTQLEPLNAARYRWAKETGRLRKEHEKKVEKAVSEKMQEEESRVRTHQAGDRQHEGQAPAPLRPPAGAEG